MQSTTASRTLQLAVHGPQRLAQLHSLGEVLQLADGDGVRRSCADDMQTGWRRAGGRWPLHCRRTPASFAAAALLPAPLLKGNLKHGRQLFGRRRSADRVAPLRTVRSRLSSNEPG
jgi:hypothetical protein